MTIVFRDEIERPGTHVLVVGVGRYPKYPGFTPEHNTVGQIDSAENGAQHIAAWFVKKFHNPKKPLASLRLLLSNCSSNAWRTEDGDVTVNAATSDNFITTYDAWIEDANAHPDSTLVLYFAGHGIGTSLEHSLICENYNEVPLRKMDGAINLNNVLWSIADRSNSSHAWIFIDTCRTSNLPQAINGNYGLSVQTDAGPIGRIGGPKITKMFATLAGGTAHGHAGKPSFFAEAVVKAFESNAYDRRNGRDWGCFSDIAFRAISKQLERIYLREDFDLSMQPLSDHHYEDSDTFLHCLPPEQVPTMMVDISCDPTSDNATHTMFCRQGDSEIKQNPCGDIWRTELTPGTYSFGAIDSSDRRCKNKQESILLPFQNIFVD